MCVCTLTQNLPAQRARASPSAGSPESTPAAASCPLEKSHRGSKVRGQSAGRDRFGRSGATGPGDGGRAGFGSKEGTGLMYGKGKH